MSAISKERGKAFVAILSCVLTKLVAVNDAVRAPPCGSGAAAPSAPSHPPFPPPPPRATLTPARPARAAARSNPA